MLSFFRSTGIIVIFAIIMIGVLTWLHVFRIPEAFDLTGNILFNTLNLWLATCIPVTWFNTWLGIVLFLVVAFMLVYANARLRLIEKHSYLPALCYVLLIGGVPEIHMFSPAIIATVLLISAFVVLVESFESERLSYGFFTAPAIISFATFFYQYMFVYMLVVWIILAAWRPGYWREWVFSVLGFALPYFFAFSWFFLIDDNLNKMSILINKMLALQFGFPLLSVSFAVFFVLIIITLGYTLRHIASKKIAVRTSYYVLVFIAVITVGMAFIVPDNTFWYLLAFPASFMMSCYFASVKSMRWGNVLLAIFFAGVIGAQAIFLFAG